MRTRKELREQRAREIYKEAAHVLCELGYERASIRDIAEATDMTKAGLYYYFKSKEELLYIILDGYVEDLISGIDIVDKKWEDPEDKLKNFIKFQIDLYSLDIDRSKLILHESNCLSGTWSDQIKTKEKNYLEYWKRAFRDYCASKNIAMTHLSAEIMMLTGMCNWIFEWYQPTGDLSPDALAELIFQRFFHGMGDETP